MTNANFPLPRQGKFLSSNVVQGFERVTISTAAQCDCGRHIKPQDVYRRGDVIEITCAGCHATFLSLEVEE
jgi:hypothetical protein